MHGVISISWKDDNHAVSEYLGSTVTAIDETVTVIMASSHFSSLLSDGSQARKTGSDKELVLIRVERGGILVYITLSLLQIWLWWNWFCIFKRRNWPNIWQGKSFFKIQKHMSKVWWVLLLMEQVLILELLLQWSLNKESSNMSMAVKNIL